MRHFFWLRQHFFATDSAAACMVLHGCWVKYAKPYIVLLYILFKDMMIPQCVFAVFHRD